MLHINFNAATTTYSYDTRIPLYLSKRRAIQLQIYFPDHLKQLLLL